MKMTHFHRIWICAALVILLCSIIPEVCGGRDFYEVLGISRDAGSPDIKKAFRKLSLKVC